MFLKILETAITVVPTKESASTVHAFAIQESQEKIVLLRGSQNCIKDKKLLDLSSTCHYSSSLGLF